MARISTTMGGTPQQQGAPTAQDEWRQPQYTRQAGIDWTDAQYASPRASRSQRFGRRRERPVADVPQLPERTIRVKAKGLGTFYTLEGTPIPGDEWVTLPISPGLIQAIKDGDLERGDAPSEPPRRAHRSNPIAAE